MTRVSARKVVALVAVAVFAIYVGHRVLDRHEAGAVRIVMNFNGGSYASVPGELHGLGGMRVVVAGGPAEFTIVGWRFRTVSPKVPVVYRLRPSPTPNGDRCPGEHVGFNVDPGVARKHGDRYPCDNFRDPRGARVSGTKQWELVAIFRVPNREGAMFRVADPVVTVRGPSGDERTVRAEYEQTTCTMGGAECLASTVADGFTTRQARRRIRMDCTTRRGTPLFAPEGDRPPREREVVVGHDDLGRPCPIAP